MVLVIAAQPIGIAYRVTLESLVHKTNLNAFSIIIFRHGIHGNQVFKWHIGVSLYNVRIMIFSS